MWYISIILVECCLFLSFISFAQSKIISYLCTCKPTLGSYVCWGWDCSLADYRQLYAVLSWGGHSRRRLLTLCCRYWKASQTFICIEPTQSKQSDAYGYDFSYAFAYCGKALSYRRRFHRCL